MNIYDLIFTILAVVFCILTLLSLLRDPKATVAALFKQGYWLLVCVYIAAIAFDSCRKKIPRTVKKACKATALLFDEHTRTVRWVFPFLLMGGDNLRRRFKRNNLGDEDVIR